MAFSTAQRFPYEFVLHPPPAIDTPAPAEAEAAGFAKTMGANEKKRRTPPAHPPYFMMIKEAISELKERGGSSLRAIAKCMEEKHKPHLLPNYKKMLAVQIKKFVLAGKLIRVKNSFKLSETAKKESAQKPKASTVGKSGIPASKPETTKKAAKSALPAAAGKVAKPAAAASRKPLAVKNGSPAKKAAVVTETVKGKNPTKSTKSSAKSPATARAGTKAPAAPAAKKKKNAN